MDRRKIIHISLGGGIMRILFSVFLCLFVTLQGMLVFGYMSVEAAVRTYVLKDETGTQEQTDETGQDGQVGFVIESVQVLMPRITAYIRGDRQIGAADIAATLDGKALNVESVGFFEGRNEGITYYVMLDVSASFSKAYFQALQGSLVNFKGKLGEKDRLVLITFGSSVKVVLDGNETADEASDIIMGLTNGDRDTYLYEALMLAADEVDANDANSREVIMMISDGGDDGNVGKANIAEAVAALNKRNIPLYGFAAGANEANKKSFVELAQLCGGSVTEFTMQESDKIFNNFVRMLGEMQVVTFMADSNIVSNKTERLEISVLADNSMAWRNVLVTDYLPDDTPPVITAVRRYSDNELIVNFSEAVKGADTPLAYTVTCDGTQLDVMLVIYDEEERAAVLGFASVLPYGEYEIKTDGITDISMENNRLSDSYTKTFSDTAPTQEATTEGVRPTESETQPQSQQVVGDTEDKGFWGNYWYVVIIVVVVVIAIAVGAIIYHKTSVEKINKMMEEERRRQRRSIQPQGVQKVMSEVPRQGADRVVRLQTEPGKKIIFEVLNVEAGQNSKIEAELRKSMVVGRADICDVVIKDNRMSRQHFAIEDKNGAIYIRDLNTTNGTSVNGVSLTGEKQLNNNDLISAGMVKVRIRW